MDFPGRLIAGILAVVLLVLFPLQYIARLNSESIDDMVDEGAHKLSDAIRDRGCLDKQMYEDYVEFLEATGERYDIEIQDIKPVKGDEYSESDITKPSRRASFERISHDEITSFATHTHTDDCHSGNLHICDHTDCEYEGNVETEIVLTTSGSIKIWQNEWNYVQRRLYSKDNGVTWSSHSSGESSIVEYTPKGYYLLNTYTWNYIDYSKHLHKYDTTTGTTYQISTDYFGSGKVKASTDKIFYRNNKYFIIIDGKSIRYSNDGITFYDTSVSGLSWQDTISDIVYGNGMYVAAGTRSGSDNDSTVFFTSTDGVTWTLVSNFGLCSYGKIIFANDRFIYGGGSGHSSYSGYLYYSYNGTNWISINRPRVSTHNCEAISYMAYGNDTLVVVDAYEQVYSTTNFGQSYNRFTDRISSLKYCDGFFYMGRSQMMNYARNSLLRSSDGITWSEIELPALSTNDYNENVLGITFNSIGDTGVIDRGPCIKQGKYYNAAGVEVQPICNTVVTSITATNPTQTVIKGKPIITTATATYLDGHTGTVNCTSNFNTNQIGTQTVILTYSGLVGNAKTTGTRTCIVNVTVKPDRNLISLTVLPASQTIQRYTQPSFTVRANYSDGTNRVLNSSEYSIAGFNSVNIGLQNVTISHVDNGITKSAAVTVTVTAVMRECPKCHNSYALNPDDTDPGCPFCANLIVGIKVEPDYVEAIQGRTLPISVLGIYNDGSMKDVTGWTSNYNPLRLGLQMVTVEYGGYGANISVWVSEEVMTCPICGTEYPISDVNCPVCAEKVVSISVSPREITVYQYEAITLTVTATYATGDTREVSDWSIDRTTTAPGTFTATVNYVGVTDTITLTVLSVNSIECPICENIYDISKNPKGCPICSGDVIGIEAYLTSGSNMVQLGTMPNIAVILIFRDDHREFASNGYTLEDYNSNELGIQTVRVVYKEFTTSIVVEVVNMLDTITCPNGHVYHKNKDDMESGCPFCNIGEDISKIAYFDITYTSEILEAIYSLGEYRFMEGNYISVIVTKKDKSLLYRLQNTFFRTSMLGSKKRFIYGGEVY